MDLAQLKSYINYVLNKDQMGEPLSADYYNILLLVSNQGYYDLNYKEILDLSAANAGTVTAKLFNNNPLKRFLKNKSYSDVVLSPIPLPDDFKKTINAVVLYTGQVSSNYTPPDDNPQLEEQSSWRTVNLVTVEELDKIRFNVLSRRLTRHPVMSELPEGFHLIPMHPKYFNVNYLRKVNDPFYDYCIGADDDVEHYMPVNSYIDEDNGTYNLYDGTGNLLVSNVIHLTATVFPYYSKSRELDWDENDISKIGDLIIGIASAKNRELELSQYASKNSTT